MNTVGMPNVVSVGLLYASTAVGVGFQGACSAGNFRATVVTNYQNTLNMSVGFINNITGDAYAFFGMDIGAFINGNTNFINVKGSTIVSGPIYTFNVSRAASASPTKSPTTVAPLSSQPTFAPTTRSPSSSVPTSSAPLTVAPSSSTPITMAPTTEAPSSSPTTVIFRAVCCF